MLRFILLYSFLPKRIPGIRRPDLRELTVGPSQPHCPFDCSGMRGEQEPTGKLLPMRLRMSMARSSLVDRPPPTESPNGRHARNETVG